MKSNDAFEKLLNRGKIHNITDMLHLTKKELKLLTDEEIFNVQTVELAKELLNVTIRKILLKLYG